MLNMCKSLKEKELNKIVGGNLTEEEMETFFPDTSKKIELNGKIIDNPYYVLIKENMKILSCKNCGKNYPHHDTLFCGIYRRCRCIYRIPINYERFNELKY